MRRKKTVAQASSFEESLKKVYELVEYKRKWDGFVNRLPALGVEIRDQWDKGYSPRALHLASLIQEQIINYASGQPGGIRVMRIFYKSLNSDIIRALPALPGTFPDLLELMREDMGGVQ